uniref:Uncharacterized protein n=1 Tax=Arundo donax TaxID=35708 RepID=A0A0A9AY05_ARUDO
MIILVTPYTSCHSKPVGKLQIWSDSIYCRTIQYA